MSALSNRISSPPGWRSVTLLATVVLLAMLVGPRAALATVTITGGNVGTQTWTAAQGPYVIEGDVNVQAGATLTIAPGTEIEIVSGDLQGTGINANRVEFRIDGALIVDGTPARPVVIHGRNGTAATMGVWYGFIVGAEAEKASFDNAVIEHAVVALQSTMTASPLVIRRTRFNANSGGVAVSAGTLAMDASVVANGGSGITVGGNASSVITNSIVRDQGSYGVAFSTAAATTHRLGNCTLVGNAYGVEILTGGTTVDVTNTIVSGGSTVGIYRGSAALSADVTVTYSNVWNNTTNFQRVVPGTGCLSANPQFADEAERDLHLQPSSVCIDSGTTTGAPPTDLDGTARPQDGDGVVDPDGSEVDMGAYEYKRPAGGTGGGAGGGGVGGTGGDAGANGGGGAGGSPSGGHGGGSAGGGAGGNGGSAGGGIAGAGGGGSGGGQGGGGEAGGGAGMSGEGGSAGGAGGKPAVDGGVDAGSEGGTGAGGRGVAGGAGGNAGSGGGGTSANTGSGGATINATEAGSDGCSCATAGGARDGAGRSLGLALLGLVLAKLTFVRRPRSRQRPR